VALRRCLSAALPFSTDLYRENIFNYQSNYVCLVPIYPIFINHKQYFSVFSFFFKRQQYKIMLLLRLALLAEGWLGQVHFACSFIIPERLCPLTLILISLPVRLLVFAAECDSLYTKAPSPGRERGLHSAELDA
jgi:hypothetical protein